MAQRFSQQPLQAPPELFSEAQDPALTSGLFWARLLAYRPLFLLGGLWLALVCVSAIAYHGLMFNEPVDNAAYTERPLTVVETLPQDLPAAEPDRGATSGSGTVALWALFSLVGLCGFGCFVLTQQIRASARPAKRKKPRPRPVVKAKPPSPPQPRRLAPYSPQRDGVVVLGAKSVEPPVHETPPDALAPGRPPRSPARSGPPRPVQAALSQPAGSRPRPPGPPNHRPATDSIPVYRPTVVSEEADLSLDWPEGSVAHVLDVRQRRSLSSFM
ncbi:hypothetical protein [Leptolyngbya sp. KIOST-1]|uniref:hypothetical protein n=1 Tax=Leptolyngbya sp. KIOST-1 TaxID=1229172 RepID=UPI0005636C60|nr:hypothetical protein [Leptolyngbya sp. KIOST-1]